MSGFSETIESREYEEILTMHEVKKLLVAHGLGYGSLCAAAEDFGVILGESYGEGEVFTWGAFMEWLGY